MASTATYFYSQHARSSRRLHTPEPKILAQGSGENVEQRGIPKCVQCHLREEPQREAHRYEHENRRRVRLLTQQQLQCQCVGAHDDGTNDVDERPVELPDHSQHREHLSEGRDAHGRRVAQQPHRRARGRGAGPSDHGVCGEVASPATTQWIQADQRQDGAHEHGVFQDGHAHEMQRVLAHAQTGDVGIQHVEVALVHGGLIVEDYAALAVDEVRLDVHVQQRQDKKELEQRAGRWRLREVVQHVAVDLRLEQHDLEEEQDVVVLDVRVGHGVAACADGQTHVALAVVTHQQRHVGAALHAHEHARRICRRRPHYSACVWTEWGGITNLRCIKAICWLYVASGNEMLREGEEPPGIEAPEATTASDMAKDARVGGEMQRQERMERAAEKAFTDISKEDAVRRAATEYDYRKRKFPIRTGMAAVSLFALGSVLIWISTRIGLDGEHRGLSFLILGLIAFIPGSYASVQLYGSFKGWKGYDYSQIPSYDD